MRKYIIMAAFVATITFAQANWFTQIFESEYDQAIRLQLERNRNGGLLTDAELQARRTRDEFLAASQEAYRNSPEGKLKRELEDINTKLKSIQDELEN